MNMLIVTGLMAFGLLAIIAAVLLAMGENKTASAESVQAATPILQSVPEQHLPAIREDAPSQIISTQFSELSAQLRVLHEQARAIEQRLSVLSNMAERIERGQSSVKVEETDDYRLLESAVS